MNNNTNGTGEPRRKAAEFDSLAEQYREVHKANIALTGEDPDFFAEYKIADLAQWMRQHSGACDRILDFGSGIGNSLPFFRKYFPNSQLCCADVSERSLEIAQGRFPGEEAQVLIGNCIPLPDASQDLVFSACVFHHIPEEEHSFWLTELLRITRPGGVLAIYEHNPLNPLTMRAVNTCPLDENAKLIRAGEFCRRAGAAGWELPQAAFKVFFPAALAALRPVEKHLQWLCLGAQYRMLARKSSKSENPS